MSDTAQALSRRHDLDWIRVAAFGLLILYHVGMFYVPWDWHVKTRQPVEWLEPIMQLTNPWRLTLLFLVSGAATRFMADKMTPGSLAGQRTWRLLPPLVFAMFVVVPPQTYFELVEKAPQLVGSYADFYGKYATASGHWCNPQGECLITPTWNHLWFVAYLFVYTLLLAALIAWAKPALRWLEARLERTPDWLLFAGPVVFLALIRIALIDRFEITHALIDDWYNHALSFGAFLFGYLMARSERLKQGFIRLRWVALVLALVSWAAWAGYAWAWRADDAVPPLALKSAMRFVYGLNQWAAITAVLGFGARHVTRGGPILTWLTVAVFPFYIAHQTVIVVAGHHLAKLALNPALEAVLLIAITAAGCLATYVIANAIPVLRPLFGLKYQPARTPEPSRPPALA